MERKRPRQGGGHSGSRSHSHHHVSSRPAHGNYYYKGRNSFFWSQQGWYPSYGCYLYWNPSYNSYYYWCRPDGYYYPISYCPYGRYSW